jgi:hypothetical protein
MRDLTAATQLLGFVQVQIGAKIIALPVQAVRFGDVGISAGGFFTEQSGNFGILVNADASEKEVREQILQASEEAVRHLSRRYLN